MKKVSAQNEEGNVVDTTIEGYHPQATARMRAYVAGDGYEGLMNADGHVIQNEGLLFKPHLRIINTLFCFATTFSIGVMLLNKGNAGLDLRVSHVILTFLWCCFWALLLMPLK